jgi:hypothetical protein
MPWSVEFNFNTQRPALRGKRDQTRTKKKIMISLICLNFESARVLKDVTLPELSNWREVFHRAKDAKSKCQVSLHSDLAADPNDELEFLPIDNGT